MNGTITTEVNVHFPDGKLAWRAMPQDKVTGSGGSTIVTLSRNGVPKLAALASGVYSLAQSGCVAWDTVTPPPDHTGPTLTHTIKVYSDGSIDVDGTPVP